MSGAEQTWNWNMQVGDYWIWSFEDGGYKKRWFNPINNQESQATSPPSQSITLPVPYSPPVATNSPGEALDPTYQIRTDARQFFIRGRMFSMLHVEPFGGTAADGENENVFIVKYGERVFCQIRRFVVVKDDKGFCLACPVATYRGRGTTKPGVNPKQHAVIFTTNSGPTWMPGETGMDKQPIGVDPADPSIRLGPASRINFAQVHCIQQNVKVKDMGLVRLDDLPKLIAYYRQEAM